MMKLEKIPLEKTGRFSPVFLDYLKRDPKTFNFYNLYPKPENFREQIKLRTGFENEKRVALREAINAQYSGIEKSEQFIQNLKLLADPGTFTVTTGHQLNIFSGPLYFMYKIVTTINLAHALKKQYPEYHFVPVYWMASEDHDIDEINHFNLFNKKYVWETSQKGAVGRFKPHGIAEVINELPEKPGLFERAYLHHKTLAEATRFFVNELFAEEGLVVLDPDHPLLKRAMCDVFREELLEGPSNHAVNQTNQELDRKGYAAQIHSREINLFYLDNNLRERIIKQDDRYEVLNSDLKFSPQQILDTLNQNPEKFSPNVVLRPLYQEMILPNLAYVGGPAEVAYWMQLKGVFDHYGVPFPIVMPRNFGLVVNKTNAKRLRKIGIETVDLFEDINRIKEKYLQENGGHYSLDDELQLAEKLFASVRSKAGAIDKSLEGFIGAEKSKVEKILKNIEKRLKKAEEQKHDVTLRQLESLKEKLFPGGMLQERCDNFLNFNLNHPGFIKFLLESFDPFDFDMTVMIEE